MKPHILTAAETERAADPQHSMRRAVERNAVLVGAPRRGRTIVLYLNEHEARLLDQALELERRHERWPATSVAFWAKDHVIGCAEIAVDEYLGREQRERGAT